MSSCFRQSIGTFLAHTESQDLHDRMPRPRSKSQLARRDHKQNKNIIKCNGILHIHHATLSQTSNWKMDGSGIAVQEPPQPQEPTGQAGCVGHHSVELCHVTFWIDEGRLGEFGILF